MLYDILIFLLIQLCIIVAFSVYHHLKYVKLKDVATKLQLKLEQTSIKLNRTIEQSKYWENERNKLQDDSSSLRNQIEELNKLIKKVETENEEQLVQLEYMQSFKAQAELLGEQQKELQFLLHQSNSNIHQLELEQEKTNKQLSESHQNEETLTNAILQLTSIKKQYEQLLLEKQKFVDDLEKLNLKVKSLEKENQNLSERLSEEKMQSMNKQNTIDALEQTALKYRQLSEEMNELKYKFSELTQKYDLVAEANKYLTIQLEENKELVSVYRKTIDLLESGRIANVKTGV
ncbi:MAG: hypothetical protein IPM47_15210 [Sphingobacteriales bacterium]|nr:MAG: hypothetical protein IPM47_15210 [Sphingobacteriales bacterium]